MRKPWIVLLICMMIAPLAVEMANKTRMVPGIGGEVILLAAIVFVAFAREWERR